jgi:hypothetical protein
MRKSLLILGTLGAALTQLVASPENAAIIAATKTYVAANSGMTKLNVAVEKVEGDFARAKVTPQDAGSADPAWVFLKKKGGKWTGLTLGTSFTTEDYQQLRIPNALRIP